MQETKILKIPVRKEHPEIHEIDLLDYINVIIKKRWLVVRNFFIAAGLGIILSLILPQKYTAVTTLLPPEENQNLQM